MGQGFQTEVWIVPDTCKEKKKKTNQKTGAVQLQPSLWDNLLWTSGSSMQEPGGLKSQPPFKNQACQALCGLLVSTHRGDFACNCSLNTQWREEDFQTDSYTSLEAAT